MSTPSNNTDAPGLARRTRHGMFAAVTLIGAAVSAIALNIAAERANIRIDLTSTGERSLSPKTLRELERLDRPHTLVLVYRGSEVNAEAAVRARDVLADLRGAQSNFRCVEIDVDSATGTRDYEAFIAELLANDADELARAESMTKSAIERCRAAATVADSQLGLALIEASETIPTIDPDSDRIRTAVRQFGLNLRVTAGELEKSSSEAAGAMQDSIGALSFVRTDRAIVILIKSLRKSANTLRVVRAECLKAVSNPKTGAQGIDRLRALDDSMSRVIGEWDSLIDALSRERQPQSLRLMDALKAGSCAVITGNGLVALDIDRILPSAEYAVEGGAAADQARRVENLIATGLSALRAPLRPIIVLMHGESRRFLDEVPIFERLIERQIGAGIDVVEWATVIEDQEPVTTELDPAGTRPKVYVVLSPDSSAKEAGGVSGLQRAEKLAAAADRIAESGKSMMIGLNPSIAPSFGKKDAMNDVLARFGVFAETGRPLIKTTRSPQGLSIETDRVVQSADNASPLSGAVRGLPTFLPWPVQLEVRGGSGIAVEPIQSIACDADTWGEARWSGIWITPRDKRGLIIDGPKFEADRDLPAKDGQTSWTVGVAAERTNSDGAPSRALIIGSNSWFMDQVAGQTATVDGRAVIAYPGNDELFDAGVMWLAGLDDLIAQSPTARAISVIAPMDSTMQSRVRFGLIFGMPLGVLVIGLLARLIRR
ncbi:MAG: hypothetical protein ACK54H_10550 [Phycisphaerales bacterium]